MVSKGVPVVLDPRTQMEIGCVINYVCFPMG